VTPSETTVAEIEALMAAKASALVAKTPDALTTLIDPCFVYLNAAGRLFDKATYIATHCRSTRSHFVSQAVSELAVRRCGSIVVATMAIDDQIEIDGQTTRGRYLSTCVFTHQDGGWVWTAGHTAADTIA